MKIAFDWQVSSYFGWGVYGLNLALEWSKRADIEHSTVHPLRFDDIVVDPLRRRALRPFIARSMRPPLTAQADGYSVSPTPMPMLDSLGNEAQGFPGGPHGRIGVIFFEYPMPATAIEKLKRYELIVTGSAWNEEVLRGHGLSNVRTILQGIDPDLHHLAGGQRRDLFPGKYLVFSGGKAEPRKGQDIVVKAFRAFAQRHPDAMLVTAWHSPWPHLAKGMDLDLSGLADRVIDVGRVPNARMPPIYRECDLAVFPNRAEGGTNLVAMECLACGVPCLLSDNTGHRDLLARSYGYPLPQRQGAYDGWGETDVDDLVEAMDMAKRVAMGHRAFALKQQMNWSRTATELLSAVESVYGRESRDQGPGEEQSAA